MRQPSPETFLALKLADIALSKSEIHGYQPLAMTACRVVSIAKSYRKLVKHGCNYPLTGRQDKRLESLQRRADDLLHPYGLELAHPWGLCMYAIPLGSDGMHGESNCTFLA